jgi:hypothetical protein
MSRDSTGHGAQSPVGKSCPLRRFCLRFPEDIVPLETETPRVHDFVRAPAPGGTRYTLHIPFPAAETSWVSFVLIVVMS